MRRVNRKNALADKKIGAILPRMTLEPLLPQIERHLARTGIGASYFGRKACGNSELVSRLRAGGGCTVETYLKVLDYLSKHDVQDAAE